MPGTGTTDHGDTTVEKFAPNGGTAMAVVGGVVVLAFVVFWVIDMDSVPLWVPAVALFGGMVLYTSSVRPRVIVKGRDLVFRNMLSTTYLPLASIEEMAVRQVMAVRAGGKRYVCSGAGRPLRQAMKGSAMQRAREQMGGLHGEMAKAAVREPGMSYADFIEIRVRSWSNRTGSAAGSSGTRRRPTSSPGRSAASWPGRRSRPWWRPRPSSSSRSSSARPGYSPSAAAASAPSASSRAAAEMRAASTPASGSTGTTTSR